MLYNVKLTPAEKTPHGFTFDISAMMDAKRQPVEAATLPDLVAQVRRLAHEFGRTCTASVTIPKNGRKPRGFDAAVKPLECIEFAPAPALNMARGQMMMDKADALRRQAEQVAHYGRTRPWLAALVAAATMADALADGEHPVVEINRHIPRGGAIEAIIARYEAAR